MLRRTEPNQTLSQCKQNITKQVGVISILLKSFEIDFATMSQISVAVIGKSCSFVF